MYGNQLWKGKAQECTAALLQFMDEHVYPVDEEVLRHLHSMDSQPFEQWTLLPHMERLKGLAKSCGLWNLFLPACSGLTQREYAPLAEIMGRVVWASEVFNCNAPDTGNMELLHLYGNQEQKAKWLAPLLDGSIRSVFGMTEPDVASSDATNLSLKCEKDGNDYVLNGRKWWSGGAGDPRAKVILVMVRTSPKDSKSVPTHKQHSTVIVPMDTPGVKVYRSLNVFGYALAPAGHFEVRYENVRIPQSNVILGEGRGFEIAQGRLGPGRIHHCMRTIGIAERALELMISRAKERVAFGEALIRKDTVLNDIAESRIAIDMSRLLVLDAADKIDRFGSKAARKDVGMIKVVVPRAAIFVLDAAIQLHGGKGVCQDTPLPLMYAFTRALRIIDGPDAVHKQTIGKMEARSSKL